jgi:hypothetical protein
MDFKTALQVELNAQGIIVTEQTQEEVLAELMNECTQERVIKHIVHLYKNKKTLPNGISYLTLFIRRPVRKNIDYDKIYVEIKKRLLEINPEATVMRAVAHNGYDDHKKFEIHLRPNDIPDIDNLEFNESRCIIF